LSIPSRPVPSPVTAVLTSARKVAVALFFISGLINVLMLTGSLFMMQVYDRVLGSQSVPTLVLLSIIAIAAYVFQGGLELIRTRILGLIAERIDDEVGPKLHAVVVDLPLRMQRSPQEAMQPFRDLDAVRGFIAGPGPNAMFDMPWIPIYLVVLFMLHWSLFAVTLGATFVLIGLTWLTEVRSKEPTKAALDAQSVRNQTADASQRGAEVVRAMGLMPVMAARWQDTHNTYMAMHRRASFVTGALQAVARVFRMVLQSAMLGLGAYLAIKGLISSGAIIACTILSGRAMAPIDQALGAWKGFVASRQAHARLIKLFEYFPTPPAVFSLPSPTRSVTVENLVVAAPGSRLPIVKRASFELRAGQALGVIGPSASGKTTLIRALIGVWAPLGGKVMLDGASIDQWAPHALGAAIGYLPQDVQLFNGTIAENIARFSPDAKPEAVIAAARAASFHDHVVAIPDGYNATVGQGGAHLSAGQRQRLGLARALYNDPFLVVLDEPNANLDAEGEAAVVEAIKSVRARQGVAIVIAHRPSAVSAVDMILAMRNGEVLAFGPRDEVFSKVLSNAPRHPAQQNPAQHAAGQHNVVLHPGPRAEVITLK
jgi:PrtD family type I secretion system ABC transporter